jgi:hypothetical protein
LRHLGRLFRSTLIQIDSLLLLNIVTLVAGHALHFGLFADLALLHLDLVEFALN